MAVLSKVQIGSTIYDLKDSTARSNVETLLGEHALEALGSAAWKSVAASINEAGLVDASIVKAYVDAQVATIPEFDVVLVADGEDLPTPSAGTFHKIYLKKASGTGEKNIYKEYITIKVGEVYSWELIGDTAVDITSKVDKTTTIAGLTLASDISVADLQKALGLKALAYKDSATGTVAAQAISGLKAKGAIAVNIAADAFTNTATNVNLVKGDYTPAGNVSVTLEDATTPTEAVISTGAYTPAGNVSAAIVKNAKSGVAVSGTVSAPIISVTPTTADITGIKSVGTVAAFKEGAYTPASLTHAETNFATSGVTVAVDTTDSEMLVFSNAATSKASLISAFSGGSKAKDTFTPNTLPTMETAVSVVTGVSATSTAPTFTGDKFAVNASFAGTEEADLKVNKVTYVKPQVKTASFAGTTAKSVLVTGATYEKAALDPTKVTASTEGLTVDSFTVTAKEVTVE